MSVKKEALQSLETHLVGKTVELAGLSFNGCSRLDIIGPQLLEFGLLLGRRLLVVGESLLEDLPQVSDNLVIGKKLCE